MKKINKNNTISLKDVDALIFDLDGVITQTARIHAKAWQQMFEAYLKKRQERGEKLVAPYQFEEDYAKYIDGKPRYEGVQSFLNSRKIELPYGEPADSVDRETICGLGNWKNQIFLKLIDQKGVEVFEDSVEKILSWKKEGLKTAIVSSSRNCKAIIEAAGISGLFDVRVDGVVSAKLQLRGKPEPDIFVKAAEKLATRPSRAIVFEDAISGVQAGRKGGFQQVVGVARRGQEKDLLKNGADLVIHDFNDLSEEW
ncbi:beta-phosphoglucomutase family hydrolase [candidate division KSB1 bacterium]|nr:beta-phosphoglucomutase family hydrolase [candidate division KSB1 bacterium]